MPDRAMQPVKWLNRLHRHGACEDMEPRGERDSRSPITATNGEGWGGGKMRRPSAIGGSIGSGPWGAGVPHDAPSECGSYVNSTPGVGRPRARPR